MADQPENIDELLRNPAFVIYYSILANHLINKATGQVFEMDNLGMMHVKTLNYVFINYNKKSCDNTPNVLAIKIQKFLARHRHMKGKFLCGQSVTDASILPIISNIEQDYMAVPAGIGAEDKYAKSSITPVIFNFPDKVITLLAY